MKLTRQWLDTVRARGYRLNRGSILLLTLFIGTGMSLMVSSLVQANLQEQKINRRAILTMEAKNAVNSATEYIISQLKLKFDNYPGINGNYFINNPVTIPSTISTFIWTGTNVTAANVTTKISLVPAMSVLYIDPTNPANAFDPNRGRNVSASDVYVYARATATNTIWNAQVTAYGTQALEVRNNPLFTNAIFYNMDLEIYPGPAMYISGPVHTNSDLWVSAQTGLTFSGPITTTGDFHVGFIPWPTNWASTQAGSDGTKVWIPNNSGVNTNPYKGSGNVSANTSYWDSAQTNYSGTAYTNWREMSANLWGGNLQTAANNVPNEQVTGYNDFVFHVNGTSQNMNYAYAIIEPAQSTNYANGTANPYNKATGENQKFERNSGLIVKVLTTGAANITTTTYVTGNIQSNGTANNTAATTAVQSNEANINTTVAGLFTTGSINSTASGNMTIAGNLVLANGTTQTFSGNLANPVSGTHSTSFPLVSQTQNTNSAVSTTLTGTTITQGGSPALTPQANTSTTLMEASTRKYYSSASGSIPANTTVVTTTRYVGVAYVEMDKVVSHVNSTTNNLEPVYDSSTAVTDSAGDVIYPGDITEQPLTVNATMITGVYNATTGVVTYPSGASAGVLTFLPAIGNMSNTTTANLTAAPQASYSGNVNDLWSGMYDNRRNMPVSMVNMDVGALKTLLDNNHPNYAATSPSFFNGTGSAAFNPLNEYNGVVYVEFPTLPGNSSRLNPVASGNVSLPGDGVLVSTDAMGLGLINADSNSTATGVPNPNYTSSTIGQAGRSNGFTVATNNALYTYGNFNADGNLATPQADTVANSAYNDTMPDVPANPDPACCLAADSVTVLSGNWINRTSKTEGSVSASGSVEFNAAVITGIVPSQSSSSTALSGGAHNYPRFLENWGTTFRYRGSMVCLFASEIATQPWSTAYYNPPTREWGFYNQFAKGIYPPGTPSSRSYFRVNFSYLTSSQYTTATTGL